MFYCETCAEKNKWPSSHMGSHGACEICGVVSYCNDVPSRALPVTETPPPDRIILKVSLSGEDWNPERLCHLVKSILSGHGLYDAEVEILDSLV